MLTILALAVEVAHQEQAVWPEFARFTDEFRMEFWPSWCDRRIAWWNAARASRISMVPA